MGRHSGEIHDDVVRRDDELLDLLGDPDRTPTDRELVRGLVAHRREVRHREPDLVDTDAAPAAMKVNVDRPFAAGVSLLVVVMMIGATLGAVLAHLVTGLVSALLWGLALAVASMLCSLGVVVYQERRS